MSLWVFHPDLYFTVKASYNAKGSHEKQWALRECIAPGKKRNPRALLAWRFSLKQCLFISVAAAVRVLAYQSVISHRKWLQREAEGKLRGDNLQQGNKAWQIFLCVWGIKGLMTNCEKRGKKINFPMTKLLWTSEFIVIPVSRIQAKYLNCLSVLVKCWLLLLTLCKY